MRQLRAPALALVVAIAAGCASPGMPPGGPVDTEAPQVLSINPDSGRTGVTPRDLVFRFNEVISERPAGAQSLAALFIISPQDGEPRLDWSRREIAVRPRRGWRPNTAYSVTILPGLADLRGNVRNAPIVTLFSTGATIPSGRIEGTLFNWVEGQPVPRALVEARSVADTTLAWVAMSDSVGRFVLSPMPPATYEVRGLMDDNRNRVVDPREAWDTATVILADSASVELLAFVHDSTGARLTSVLMRDSVTLELTFDNPLSVAQPLTPAGVRVRASDSTDVPIVAVEPPPADTLAARRPSRPSPPRMLVVRLGQPLRPRATYRVSVTDARNLLGIARNSERSLTVPAPQPPPAAVPDTAGSRSP